MDKGQFNVKGINIEPLKLFRPVISGLLLNAHYSALILKKLSGMEITPEIEAQAWIEIHDRMQAVEDQWDSGGTAPQTSENR